MEPRRLDDRHERLRGFRERGGRLAEQIEIGKAPHVGIGRFPRAFLKQVQPFDVVGEEAPDVGPARAAADHVIFAVAFELIHHQRLIHQCLIAGTGAAGAVHVRDAGHGGEDGAGGGARRCEEQRIIQRILGEGHQVRRSVLGNVGQVGREGRARPCHGLHDDDHHIQRLFLPFRRGAGHRAHEVELLRIRVGYAEPCRDAGVAFPGGFDVRAGPPRGVDRIEEVLDGVQGEDGDVFVHAEKGVAPTQREEVGADLSVAEEEQDHECGEAPSGAAFPSEARCGFVPGQRFAEEQGVQRRNHDEPERDPDDGVTFPDHRPGDVRVAEQFEQARVHAGVHVEEPAEIDDVHERGRGENRGVQQVDQATEASAADQKALKRRDPEDERHGDEPEYDHANIELRTDVQGVQDVGSGVPGHFRPEDAEHGSSRQHKRQQRANKKDAEGADKRGEERCLLHFFCIGRARENVKYLEKEGKRTGEVCCPARNDRADKL